MRWIVALGFVRRLLQVMVVFKSVVFPDALVCYILRCRHEGINKVSGAERECAG